MHPNVNPRNSSALPDATSWSHGQVRSAPWAGTQTVTAADRPTSWQHARELGGLDWDPIRVPMYDKVTTLGADGFTEEYVAMDGYDLIVRSDNRQLLAPAADTFEMITNTDMGLVMDTLLGRDNLRFETAGSGNDGKQVWALLQYGDQIQIGNDPSPTSRYMAFLNRHDGHGSLKVIPTNVRVWCQNTFHAAEMDAKDRNLATWSFHHRANWKANLDRLVEEIDQAMETADTDLEKYRVFAEEMCARPVTPTQEQRFVDEFVFPTREEWKLKPRALENVTVARQEVSMLLAGPTCEGIRGSAYGLMQAGVEYLDHSRAFKDSGTYLNRCVFDKEAKKTRAVNIAKLAAQGVL